jgi:hypothetical protein
VGVGAPDVLGPIIETSYPNGDHYEIGTGQWLVADDAGTAMEVATKLKITTEASLSTAIVITAGGYFGRYAAPLWEWMRAKQSPNG